MNIVPKSLPKMQNFHGTVIFENQGGIRIIKGKTLRFSDSSPICALKISKLVLRHPLIRVSKVRL